MKKQDKRLLEMGVFANDEVFGLKYAKMEGFHLSAVNQTDTQIFASWNEKSFLAPSRLGAIRGTIKRETARQWHRIALGLGTKHDTNERQWHGGSVAKPPRTQLHDKKKKLGTAKTDDLRCPKFVIFL